MELINATRMPAAYNVGLEPSGRELLVIVVKGTFVLPRNGEPVRLHEVQQPLVMADTFTAEPGLSAPVHEIDFAPRKSACDVLLVGRARTPDGRQLTRMRASLQVGKMHKAVEIVGDRVWQAGLTGITASAPKPFHEMPVSYDRAYGGVDHNSPEELEHDAYMANPAGRGWHKHLKNSWVDGKPLPNTEEPGAAVSFPGNSYRPMAFGPLGRHWSDRARYAGTYDAKWLDEVCPFLPADFNERFHQAAPADQQIPVPGGPTQVTLIGFAADGARQFVLPHFNALVEVFPKRSGREFHAGLLDTIVLEPDAERLTLTWRVTRALRKSIFEVAQVRVGVQHRERWFRESNATSSRRSSAAAASAPASTIGAG